MQFIRRVARNKWLLSAASFLALLEATGAGRKW